MRSVLPATCEIARTASDPPGTSGTPTIPSLPIVATSTMFPSASGVTNEITRRPGNGCTRWLSRIEDDGLDAQVRRSKMLDERVALLVR